MKEYYRLKVILGSQYSGIALWNWLLVLFVTVWFAIIVTGINDFTLSYNQLVLAIFIPLVLFNWVAVFYRIIKYNQREFRLDERSEEEQN